MLQVLIDSFIYGSELSLLAIGVTMVYGALRFPNFAHVEFATFGAYIAYVVSHNFSVSIILSIIPAIVAAGVLGIVVDLLIFRRLRESSSILLMITSFGLAIVMRESIRAFYGTSPVFYPVALQKPIHIWGATITPIQITIMVVTLGCMCAFHLLLNSTKLGMAMRSTADNPDLAEASGINTENVIRYVWLIGCGMAGLAGMMIGLETQIHPNMGFTIIIPVFCGAILGGIGNPYGAVIGAFVVSLAQNIGLAINWGAIASFLGIAGNEYLFIPVGYKEAIPFVLLILVLLLKPQGIMGDPNR